VRPSPARSDTRDSGAALARDLGRLGDQRFSLAHLVEEDDRGLSRHARVVGAVADIGKGAVGEREDHAAMREAVAVEHVGAHHHRHARIILAHFVNGDAPGRAGAFGRKHVVRHARCEFVCVHRSSPSPRP